MGIGGTAAAKENSDIIILDDSFSTIVKVSCIECMQKKKKKSTFLAVRFHFNHLVTFSKVFFLDNAGHPMVSISIHQHPKICPVPAHSECFSGGYLCGRGCVL